VLEISNFQNRRSKFINTSKLQSLVILVPYSGQKIYFFGNKNSCNFSILGLSSRAYFSFLQSLSKICQKNWCFFIIWVEWIIYLIYTVMKNFKISTEVSDTSFFNSKFRVFYFFRKTLKNSCAWVLTLFEFNSGNLRNFRRKKCMCKPYSFTQLWLHRYQFVFTIMK
jgi:hypothetical protein